MVCDTRPQPQCHTNVCLMSYMTQICPHFQTKRVLIMVCDTSTLRMSSEWHTKCVSAEICDTNIFIYCIM